MQGRVGGRVVISCAVEECEGGQEAFHWSKAAALESPNYTKLYSIERTLEFTVTSAEEGGYYKCFAYCRTGEIAITELRGVLSNISGSSMCRVN